MVGLAFYRKWKLADKRTRQKVLLPYRHRQHSEAAPRGPHRQGGHGPRAAGRGPQAVAAPRRMNAGGVPSQDERETFLNSVFGKGFGSQKLGLMFSALSVTSDTRVER